MSREGWADELRIILDKCTSAQTELKGISDSALTESSSRDEFHRRLHILWSQVSEIRQTAQDAFDRYSASPLRKLMQGSALSEEEFHLLRAMGSTFGTVKALGLFPFDDFEVLSLLHYEDDEWCGYINAFDLPSHPETGGASLRIGRPPEEVRISSRRSEQSAFFRTHLPATYSRFKKH